MKLRITISLFLLICSISLFSQNDCNSDSCTIKIMAFNVWNEGTSVTNGLMKIRDVIVDVNPDIIAFSEVRNLNGENWTFVMSYELTLLGYYYNIANAGMDLSILSKFPITNASQIVSDDIARFDVDINGNNVIICPVHLDPTYYTSYFPRGYNCVPKWEMIDDGNGNPKPQTDIDTILSYNLNGTRDESIATFLTTMKEETDPIILLGDFNEPSHLDWTEKTKDLFDHHQTIIPWHVSSTLSKAGYLDAYRVFFPDELSNPGFSWPSYVHDAASTSCIPLADERERIDFVYYKGNNVEVTNTALVGPKESYMKNEVTTTNTENENYLASDLDWPSDHKAIYVELKIKKPSPQLKEKDVSK